MAAAHGAHNVRVFGSTARGDAGPDSDVDFLVELERGRGLFELIRFEEELADLLDADVEVLTEGFVSRYMRDRVRAEAVAL